MAATITEEQFADEACCVPRRQREARVVETKKEWGEGSDAVALFAEQHAGGGARRRRARQGVAQQGVRRRLRLDHRSRASTAAASCRRRTSGSTTRSRPNYSTPSQGPFGIGLGMVAPDDPGPRHRRGEGPLPPLDVRGEIVGCQLFSEPAAGSDLAGLQTKAIRDGDEWIVTGQKVWTSGAQFSDIGEIICRTDPDAPKHKGLTGFIVDMHAPGVEVRPLRQMTGGASFNEVFFTEVRVPDDHRLGDVNEGWTVALTTLMNERRRSAAAARG